MKRLITAVLLIGSSLLASAQTQINPLTQVKWTTLTGSGAPTISCTSVNYGQPYTDITTGDDYKCAVSGWVKHGAGGGGTVNPGATYQVPCYPLLSGATLAPCNITSDSTGNNLNVPGNVAANATVPALLPVSDITNPTYGAIGNDTTDAAPAIRAAFAAVVSAGHGTVYFPRGTYRISSYAPGHSNGIVFASADHLHVQCAVGAVIDMQDFAGGSSAPAVLHLDATTWAFPSSQTYYNVTPISAPGAQSITFPTPTDTSNFTVGQDLYLFGAPGTEAGWDGEQFTITSINSGTGVVGLDHPTSKPYTGNASSFNGIPLTTVAAIPVPSGASGYRTDLSVEGCTVINTPRDFVFVDGPVKYLKIKNNIISMQPTGVGLVMNPSFMLDHFELSGNYYEAGLSTFTQLAWGNQNGWIHDNTIKSPYANNAINPSQGVVNTSIDRNKIYLTLPSGSAGNIAGILFATSYRVSVTNNDIVVSNGTASTATNAIQTGSGNGHCTECVFNGNNILVNNGSTTASDAGISDQSTGATISNNTVHMIGGRTVGIQLHGATTVFPQSVAIGNKITLDATTSSLAYGILVDGSNTADAQAIVNNNQVFGINGALGAGFGFFSPAPGGDLSHNTIYNMPTAFVLTSGTTGAPQMIGNVCVGVTTTTNCGSVSVLQDSGANGIVRRTAAGQTTTATAANVTSLYGSTTTGCYLEGDTNTCTIPAGAGTQIPYAGLVERWYPGGATTTTIAGSTFIPCASTASIGVTSATASGPVQDQWTSGGTSGNCAGFASQISATTPVYEWRAGSQPQLLWSWSFSASGDYSSNARIQMGVVGGTHTCAMSTIVAVASGSNPASCDYAFIRYDTSLSDTTYLLCTDNDTGTPACTAIGSVAPTVATVFASMTWAASMASVTACLNTTTPATSGTCVTNSTKLIGTGEQMYDFFANTTLTAAATHVRIGPIEGHSQGTQF